MDARDSTQDGSKPIRNASGSVVVKLHGRLPSWNQILEMNRWERHRYRKQTLSALLSACIQSGNGSLMKIISAKNPSWMRSATAGSSLTIEPPPRKSKSASGNASMAKKSML